MVKGIYVLLTMFLLMGCATVMNPYKMDNRMHKIELGMTKQKVISILGKDFESAGARITPDGPIESISYKTVTMTIADYSEGYYILSFKNGILVEWFKEKTPINNNTAELRSPFRLLKTNKADASGHLPSFFYDYKLSSIHESGYD